MCGNAIQYEIGTSLKIISSHRGRLQAVDYVGLRRTRIQLER